jgi:hypothetical protein
MHESYEDQLPLLDPGPRPWQIDERTREIGRRGLAEARAALRRGQRQETHRQEERAA